jgi:magnesium transporter
MSNETNTIEHDVTQRFVRLYPEEAAALYETMPPDQVGGLLEQLPSHDAALLFGRFKPDTRADVLEVLSTPAFRALVSQVDPSHVASALARLSSEDRTRKLASLSERDAKELSDLMSYPADSAGGIMDPRVTTFRPDSTVDDVVKQIRKLRTRRIAEVFVISDDGRLVGSVPLQNLVTATARTQLSELIGSPAASIQAMAPRDEVLEVLEQSKMASLPVTDFDGRVIGVIRQEALIAAAQAEATADIQTMVGASRDERALSPVTFAVRRRLPWLQINLGTAFLAAAVVGLFEGTIARFTALAVLLPVVAGQSGNTGSQALVVTMRGLALREIRSRHWLRVTLKEIATGAVNGLAVSVVTGAAVYVWSQSLGLAAVISIAMVLSMAIAGLAGASIPIVLEKLGQDPAQASSIILTTVTDVVGFMSFLGLATLAAGVL